MKQKASSSRPLGRKTSKLSKECTDISSRLEVDWMDDKDTATKRGSILTSDASTARLKTDCIVRDVSHDSLQRFRWTRRNSIKVKHPDKLIDEFISTDGKSIVSRQISNVGDTSYTSKDTKCCSRSKTKRLGNSCFAVISENKTQGIKCSRSNLEIKHSKNSIKSNDIESARQPKRKAIRKKDPMPECTLRKKLCTRKTTTKNEIGKLSDTDNDIMTTLIKAEGLSRFHDDICPGGRKSSTLARNIRKEPKNRIQSFTHEANAESGHDDSEWEEVEDHGEASKHLWSDIPVEITINDNCTASKKRPEAAKQWQECVKRKMGRIAREMRSDLHKVHLLCLLAYGVRQNGVSNEDIVKAAALSIVPLPLLSTAVKKMATPDWLSIARCLKKRVSPFLKPFQDSCLTVVKVQDLLHSIANSNVTDIPTFVMIIVSALRGIGLRVRLVISFFPIPLKADSVPKNVNTVGKAGHVSKQNRELCSQGCDVSLVPSTSSERPSRRSNSDRPVPSHMTSESGDDDGDRPVPSHRTSESGDDDDGDRPDCKYIQPNSLTSKETSRKLRASERIKKISSRRSGCEHDVISFRNSGLKLSNEQETISMDAHAPDGSRLDSKCIDRKAVLTDLRQKRSGGMPDKMLKHVKSEKADSGRFYWLEVFSPVEGKWICLDCFKCVANKPYDISAIASLSQGHDNQPLHYALGFENDGCVKDLTAKYAPHWLQRTRKERVDSTWWSPALRPFLSRDFFTEMQENEEIKAELSKHPLPTSLSEYKHHPLYVLCQHLLKYEAVYPQCSIPVGYFRQEPVYARECVHTLHSRQNWLKEARVVRVGEAAYKMVKSRMFTSRVKMSNSSQPDLELFGRWQTDVYVPPPAVDGKVPKNEYGNVELFQPSMLPAGTVHLRATYLNKVARKLGVDFAPAMTGWDFHSGFCHPLFDGWVVCVEHKDVLLAGCREEQQIQEQREEQKRLKHILGNWTTLVRGVLIRDSLQRKFNLKEHQTDDVVTVEGAELCYTQKVATDTQHAWPRIGKSKSRDHGGRSKFNGETL